VSHGAEASPPTGTAQTPSTTSCCSRRRRLTGTTGRRVVGWAGCSRSRACCGSSRG